MADSWAVSGGRGAAQILNCRQYGRVRSNSNRQRQNGDDGKARIAPQAAQRMTHIAPGSLDPHKSPHIAHFLPNPSLIAKAWYFAVRLLSIPSSHRPMKGDFVAQIPVECAALTDLQPPMH